MASTNVRQILPRVESIENDRKPSYPTISRTGDSRLGRTPKVFDDTKTIIFKTGSNISYPTTLIPGTSFLNYDLKSTIEATGNVTPSAVDQFVTRESIYNNITFTEGVADLEQNGTSNREEFFLTGTKLSDIGYIFTSKLNDKTKIVIELPISEKTTFLATTGSTLYYNLDRQRFETKLVGSIQPGTGTNGNLALIFGTDEAAHYAKVPATSDSPNLFDPFGKFTLQKFATITTASYPYSFNIMESSQIYAGIFSNNPKSNILVSSLTTPTASNLINLERYIGQPFMLEKSILQIPIEAGPGWLEDQTKYSVAYKSFGNPISTGPTPDSVFDIGGPAITFGLLQHHGGDLKSIIMSGSLIPYKDDTAFISQSLIYSSSAATVFKRINHPAGFKFFGKAAGTVRPDISNFFTGTANLFMDCQVSSGIRSTFVRNDSKYNSASFIASNFQGIDIIGRTKSGQIDNSIGRSIYGKDLATPLLTPATVNYKHPSIWAISASLLPATTEDVVHYEVEKYTKSPYVLNPKDNIFLTLTKHRPTFVSATFSNSQNQLVVTQSHDIKINTGTLRLVLYGSLIRNDREYHDTLNQQLVSAEISETIGFEPIVDQNDLFFSQEFSGSYIDRFRLPNYVSSFSLTASIQRDGLQSNFVMSNQRALTIIGKDENNSTGGGLMSASADWIQTRRYGEYAQKFRNVVHISNNERYFDSVPPKLSDLLKIENPEYTIATGYNLSIPDKIQMGYIFSSYFSAANRIITKDSEIFRTTAAFYKVPEQDISYRILSPGSFRGIANEKHTDSDEFKKIVFGFGKIRTDSYNSSVSPRNGYLLPAYPHILPSTPFNWGSDPTGWKYGLQSALPYYSRTVFRRNSFGQPRDMLEQRVDTKFYDSLGVLTDGTSGGQIGATSSPVQVKFVDYLGNTSDPAKTWSSNLSSECTSSMPYFDGLVKNREEPINVSLLNILSSSS